MQRLLSFATLAVLTIVSAARADFAWVEAESRSVTPGAVVSIAVVAGSEFGAVGTEVATHGAKPFAFLNGESIMTAAPLDIGVPWRCSVTLPRAGVAEIGATLQPKTREIATDRVGRYLRELGVSAELRAEWAALNAPAWRERREERTKTYVRVGQPVAGRMAAVEKVDGQRGFDLDAENDPLALRSGEPFEVRVTLEGKPVRECVVVFESRGGAREHVVTTDGDGRAVAVCDTGGEWLVRATLLQRHGSPEYDWAVSVASMTVLVASAPAHGTTP